MTMAQGMLGKMNIVTHETSQTTPLGLLGMATNGKRATAEEMFRCQDPGADSAGFLACFSRGQLF